MRYKLLGKTGMRVSELCLGAMTFGSDWGFGADKQESKKIYDHFLNKGGNFIDTAVVYTNGTSEKYLGEFMGSERSNLVVASKYSLMDTKKINHSGNHYKNMIESVETSLKRMKTDYIDLYYVHAWDNTTDPEQLMRTLEYLVQSGKVLSLGVSDTPAWVTSRCNTISEMRGWSPFSAYQVEYCLTERTADREILPLCDAYNMTFHGFGPLAAGLLTGKYVTDDQGPKRMTPGKSPRLSERNLEISRKLNALVADWDMTPSQAAIRWAMQRFPNSSPIFGARSLKQCEENLKVLDFKLSDDQMAALEDISKISLGFPHDFLQLPRIKEILYAHHLDQIDW